MAKSTIEIRLPDLGEVDEVQVVQWLKPTGADVAADDELLEVETEKTTFVVPSPATGRLIEVIAVEGTKVKRGGVLGRIEPPG